MVLNNWVLCLAIFGLNLNVDVSSFILLLWTLLKQVFSLGNFCQGFSLVPLLLTTLMLCACLNETSLSAQFSVSQCSICKEIQGC